VLLLSFFLSFFLSSLYSASHLTFPLTTAISRSATASFMPPSGQRRALLPPIPVATQYSSRPSLICLAPRKSK
jgi:hypothetical protein